MSLPGISTNPSSATFLPNTQGAPETIPVSPVCNTNSTSGKGSSEVIRASSVKEVTFN